MSTLAGGGGRCDIEGGSNPAWCGRAALSPRGPTPDTRLLTPGPGTFGCNGLQESSQVGYITMSGAAGYFKAKVQNIVKLYLYYFVTTRDGIETKTIPPNELLFCPVQCSCWRRVQRCRDQVL